MPKRTDLKRIMLIGSGSVRTGQDCEFDCSGIQGAGALKEEGYEVVAVNSSPAAVITDPDLTCRACIGPVEPDTVARIIRRERPDAILPTLGGQSALNMALALARSGVLDECGVELLGLRAESIEKTASRELFRQVVRSIGLDVPANEAAVPDGPGWKECAMEVVRDRNDTCLVVCSFENLDPMGGHAGGSITVAPAQTLTGVEYRKMRDAAIALVRVIGVESGNAGVWFGVNPAGGELAVIRMSPRVSRTSVLASKATGFPIARIAAKLAVGYTLDELPNDVIRNIPASLEPAIDCCAVTIPCSALEDSPCDTGEIMAIGRTFKEALNKGLRSLKAEESDLGRSVSGRLPERENLARALRTPHPRRVFALRQAFLAGFTLEDIHRLSAIDPWFLRQFEQLALMEARFRGFALANAVTQDNPELRDMLHEAKSHGFSDCQIAALWKRPEADIKALRRPLGIVPAYYPVDPCAAEFDSRATCFYSTYEGDNEVQPEHRKKVIILGGGCSGVDRSSACDYCCCHAAFALRDAGLHAVMIDSNPENASTNHDTSNRLYFEPLTFEDVMHVVELERPDGVIAQFGGQASRNLAMPLLRAGAPLLGTSPDAIDRVEDPERFQALIRKLNLLQPARGARPDCPALIGQFLENAITADADALADGTDVYVAGIMEHGEQAGIHSDGASRVSPLHALPPAITDAIGRQTVALARELRVVGLMHVRFAVKDGILDILAVNLHASRTVPFVSRATGVPLPRLATQIMLGKTLKELAPWDMRRGGIAVPGIQEYHAASGVQGALT